MLSHLRGGNKKPAVPAETLSMHCGHFQLRILIAKPLQNYSGFGFVAFISQNNHIHTLVI